MKQTEFNWQGQAGQKIFAQEWQPEGDPRGAIALVHGLGEHSGRYQHVAETFTQAGYALVSCDLPGHGRTEGPRGLFSYTEGLIEIDHLLKETANRCPGVPRFIYGHSMGGVLVLYYTLMRRPDLRGAIVTSPGLAAGTPVPSWKRTAAKLLANIFPSFTMANGLDRNNLSHDQAVIHAYDADPLTHDRVSALLGRDILTRGDWIIDQASDYPLPLLLMQGSKDHIVSTQATDAFARRVPAEKLTYRIWEGLYHETHNEPEKAQVLQTMVDWLDQHA